MSRWHVSLAVVWALALVAGCSRQAPAPARRSADDADEQAAKPRPAVSKARPHVVRKTPNHSRPVKPKPPSNPLVAATEDEGVLAGRVFWKGDPDPLAEAVAARAARQTVAVDGKKVPVRLTPRLRINPRNQGIANAVVWLEKAPEAGAADPADDLELRQRDGDFHPHLLAARTGTRLKLISADDRATFQLSGALGASLALTRGKQALRTLNRPGLVEVRSESQPYASAYVWVFEHRYYALTDADGGFRLPKVRAGKYRLVLWHEGWRPAGADGEPFTRAVRREITITLDKDEGKAVAWALSKEDAEKSRMED